MNVRKLFVHCLLVTLASATAPAFAFTLPIVLLPVGHWESEEKFFIQFNYPYNGLYTDYGFTEGQKCQGFYLISERQRFSTGPTSPDGYSTIDSQAGDPNAGFFVDWTWVPPVQNPDAPPTSFNVFDSASASVSVIEGSSPPEGNSGVAGATAAIFGIVSATAKTYGLGVGYYSNNIPGTTLTATETVAVSGKRTCKTNGHTVAYVTSPSQHFWAYAQMSWSTNL